MWHQIIEFVKNLAAKEWCFFPIGPKGLWHQVLLIEHCTVWVNCKVLMPDAHHDDPGGIIPVYTGIN